MVYVKYYSSPVVGATRRIENRCQDFEGDENVNDLGQDFSVP